MDEALAVVELLSVPAGLAALDALTKRARVRVWGSGLIEPGRYLLLYSGALAEVEEAHAAAHSRGGADVHDSVLISHAHRDLEAGLRGERRVPTDADAVGIVEGSSVSGVLGACDASLKNASVSLCGLTLTPGMGGRAFFAVHGDQSSVEAAIDVAREQLGSRLWRTECLPRPTPELLHHLLAPGTFQLREG